MITQHADGSVEFAFYRPGARTVRLAADFNLWDAVRHELTPSPDGWWRLTTRLPLGDYRFKYVVDGSLWETDYAASGVESDMLGGWNALLVVEDPATLAHPALEVDAILGAPGSGAPANGNDGDANRETVVTVIDRDAELSRIAKSADELHESRRAA